MSKKMEKNDIQPKLNKTKTIITMTVRHQKDHQIYTKEIGPSGKV